MKKQTILFLILILALIASGCSSTSPSTSKATGDEKEPIVIGSTLALTGSFGFAGTAMKESMDLVVEKVNKEGGINGHPILIKQYDDENIPEKAVNNANKLIREDKVKVILGPSVGATSKAVQSLADQNKIIMFSFSGAYLAPANSFGFASSYGQEPMHELIHKWVLETGKKKVGMVATNDVSGDVSVGVVEPMKGQDGVQYVIERMGVQDLDITPQLTKIRNEGVEALVIVGPGKAAGVAIQNAVNLGLDMPIIVTHSQLSDVFAKSIKDFVPNQMLFTGPPVMAWEQLDDQAFLKPKLKAFAEDFQAKYGKRPDYLNAISYDSTTIVLEAMKKVGNDPQKIKDYLENEVKNFEGYHAVFNLSPEDHRGTGMDGLVLLRLDKELKWHIEWSPEKK